MGFDFPSILEGFLNALAAGLLVGALFGLMSTGVGLVYGVMGVINFAQGEFMMLGMYLTLFLSGTALVGIVGPDLSPFVAALLAGPVLFVFGYGCHIFLLKRVTGVRGANVEAAGHYAQLILTLGLSLILANGGLILFGSEPRAVKTPLALRAFQINVSSTLDVTVFLNHARLVVCGLAILIALLVYVFMTRTQFGRSLRAAADNPTAALYAGINVDAAFGLAFAIGAGITGIAGGLLATYYTFQPYVGNDFSIIMYVGVVLGGVGSLTGSFWGGAMLGLIQQLSSVVLPIQLQNTAIFVVFLATLLLRPQGLFGRLTERT